MFKELGILLESPRGNREEVFRDSFASLQPLIPEVTWQRLQDYDHKLRAVSLLLERGSDLTDAIVLTDAATPALWPWQIVAALWTERQGPHLVLRSGIFADYHLQTAAVNGRSAADDYLGSLDASTRQEQLGRLREQADELNRTCQLLFDDVINELHAKAADSHSAGPTAVKDFADLHSETPWGMTSEQRCGSRIGVDEQGLDVIFAVDSSTKAHGLVAGQTGSGKSRFLHALLLGLCWEYGPDELKLYLLDYKSGTEFKSYAGGRGRAALPHLEVLGLASDVEFGASAMKRVDEILDERASAFDQAEYDHDTRVADLATYRKVTGKPMARILLVIDECQILLNDDDPDGGLRARAVLQRIIEQGRSYGVHVLLSSQEISSVKNLARARFENRAILRASEVDATLVGHRGSLNIPERQAMVTDQGDSGQAVRTAIAAIDDQAIMSVLATLAAQAQTRGVVAEPIIFRGESSPDPLQIPDIMAGPADNQTAALSFWVGLPSAVRREPLAVRLLRERGGNLLIAGQNQAATVSTLVASLMQILSREPSTEVVLLDCLPATSPYGALVDGLAARYPASIRRHMASEAPAVLDALNAELERGRDATAPSKLLVGLSLERADGLGSREQRDINDRIAQRGPEQGAHLMLHYGDPHGFREQFSEPRPFGWRLLFAMETADAERYVPLRFAKRVKDYPTTQAGLWSQEDPNTMTGCRPFVIGESSMAAFASFESAGDIIEHTTPEVVNG